MHYYQFNIGDYASHTRGLSDMEDLAYRRMIDQYYLDEQPLNGCSTDVARMVGLREHEDSVDYVLNRFFEQIDGRWIHHRIESDIAAFRDKQEKASAAGKASAKSRAKSKEYKTPTTDVQQSINGRSADVQPTNNHKPITNNQLKESRASPFTPPTVQEVSDYLFEKGMTFDPERFVDFYESKGWLVGKTKMKCWKAAARTWSKRDDEKSQTSRQSSIRDELTDTSWAN